MEVVGLECILNHWMTRVIARVMNLRQNQCCYSTPSSAITSLHLCFVPLFKSSLFYLFFIVHFALYFFPVFLLWFFPILFISESCFSVFFFLRFLSTYGRRFLYYGFHINNEQLYPPPLFFSFFFSFIPTLLLFFTFSPLIRLFLLSPSLPYHLNHTYKTKKERKKRKKKKTLASEMTTFYLPPSPPTKVKGQGQDKPKERIEIVMSSCCRWLKAPNRTYCRP